MMVFCQYQRQETKKNGILEAVSATWCLLTVHRTEKLNRFERDDRPHNSIPLDEMTGGRANPPARSPARQVRGVGVRAGACRNSHPSTCKWWGVESQPLCFERFKGPESCCTHPYIFLVFSAVFLFRVFHCMFLSFLFYPLTVSSNKQQINKFRFLIPICPQMKQSYMATESRLSLLSIS
jgi:hypothetical protein